MGIANVNLGTKSAPQVFVFAFAFVVASLSGLLRGRGCAKRGPGPAHVNRAWNQTDHFDACGIIFRLILMSVGD